MRNERKEEKETSEIKEVSKLFEIFLRKAGSKSASDQMHVGRIVKKLGGWQTVNPWLASYKNGKSAADILKAENASMKDKIKLFLEGHRRLLDS